ncbi:hypothetical protein BCR34DRAFT_175382 [Clohesyomyces aquaticus]|uniref:Uncharacterized protein n=1 Tax=Clohesyomyces aquaticus TaxID=1231657 RepID=A0A1Y1YFU3_9PLEO|nr:hypothetical protein BCR34DRAFT_175382 [Clohesyomyces aquaticus]
MGAVLALESSACHSRRIRVYSRPFLFRNVEAEAVCTHGRKRPIARSRTPTPPAFKPSHLHSTRIRSDLRDLRLHIVGKQRELRLVRQGTWVPRLCLDVCTRKYPSALAFSSAIRLRPKIRSGRGRL